MSQSPIISLRFDIDTVTGIKYGLKPLLEIARELGVQFSFFVNMGKSFDAVSLMSRMRNLHISTPNDREGVCKQNLLKRLGTVGFIQTVSLNPCLGVLYHNHIMSILDEGHELGLHGGHNHALWQYRLGDMSTDEIRSSLSWAIRQMENVYGISPCGFAAPGFTTDLRVETILEETGFRYSGDSMDGLPRRSSSSSLFVIPANLIGPGGVPLIEYLCCAGYETEEVVRRIRDHMQKVNSAIIYGHPSFEGRHPEVLKQLLKVTLNAGWRVLTHQQIVEELLHGSES